MAALNLKMAAPPAVALVQNLLKIQNYKGTGKPHKSISSNMIHKCCSGDGEGRKDKGCDGGSRSKTSCM